MVTKTWLCLGSVEPLRPSMYKALGSTQAPQIKQDPPPSKYYAKNKNPVFVLFLIFK